MKLVIKGTLYDGEYEFDGLTFTNREMHRIKIISSADGAKGLRGAEIIDALINDDWAAYVAIAVVILERHDRVVDPDDLWDAESGTIKLDLRGNGDARPPGASGIEPAGSSDIDENEPSSGETST